MELIPRGELQIVSLTKRHELTSFNCISDELNEFLKDDALKDQDDMISRTYLCSWKNTLIGFFSIVADTIEVRLINEADRITGYPYRKYPGIKIARLAVDKNFERRGIGTFLILAAMGAAISVSEKIGCRYLTVDSKTDSIGFYEKLHFKIVENTRQQEPIKMYTQYL